MKFTCKNCHHYATAEAPHTTNYCNLHELCDFNIVTSAQCHDHEYRPAHYYDIKTRTMVRTFVTPR